MHRNPRAFKYRWWVFHASSPCDGHSFLTQAYELSTAQAHVLMGALEAEEQPFWLYNKRSPRLPSPGSPPWDQQACKWQQHGWAPTLDDDLDQPFDGHK